MIKFKRKKRDRRTLGGGLFGILMGVFFLCIFAAVFFVGTWVLEIAQTVPEFTETSFENQQTSYIYDNEGNMYSNLYVGENRTTVHLAEMPEYLIDVLVATEDKRFYDHMGVDIIRIFGALRSNILSGSIAEGASTITMQVARNSILNNQEKELTRKVQEALLALEIEREYSKEEILEFYLNEVYFGHGVNGVQAASQLYFGKDVQDITLSEAAMLIGLLRNPGTNSPYNSYENAIDVRDVALNNLISYKPEYEEAALAAKQEELTIQSSSKDIVVYEYPWFTDYVIEQLEKIMADLGYSSRAIYDGGFSIYTTLDADIQAKMEELYADPANFPESTSADLIESAMVVMDPYSGAIKGIIGGREHTAKRSFNRATDLQRQPGSTIKPLVVYTPALEMGYGTGSVVIDEKTTFGKNWTPRNSNGRFNGPMTMRNAVRNSTNIPAIKFLEFVGIETAWDFGNEIGLGLQKEDKVLPLALGGLTTGVSPLQMATAFSIFPSMGVYSGNYVIEKIVDNSGATIYQHETEKKAVISEVTAYLMTDMLVTVTQSGTGTAAKMDRPVASKTGTTSLPDTADFRNKDGNRDAWFAAYTPELVGIVWMGYDTLYDSEGNPQYLPQVYGGKYPAQLWKKVMEYALADAPIVEFTDPGGWEYASIDKTTGLAAGATTPQEYVITEKYAKGTAPEVESMYEELHICKVSGLLASGICSDYTVKMNCVNNPLAKVEYDEEGNIIPDPTIPTETCSTCVNGYTTGAFICTNPMHGGVLYLANVVQEGQVGGCPAEEIKFFYFEEGTAPSTYCNIAEHMITDAPVDPNVPVDPDQPDIPVDPNDPDQPDIPVDPNDPDQPVEPDTPTEPDEPYIPDDIITTDDVFKPSDLVATVKTSAEGPYAQLSWNGNGNDSKRTLYAIIKITNSMQKETLTTYDTAIIDRAIEEGNTYTYMVYATRPDLGTSSSYTAGFTISP